MFYGVLDIFSQGVFALLLILATRKLDFDRMGLGFTEYGRIRDHDHWRDSIHQEKVSRTVPATGNGNYAANGNYSGGGGGVTGVSAPGVVAPGGVMHGTGAAHV